MKLAEMASTASVDYESLFKNQTVFLTGGTGGLGGCILYKLSLELPTRKIYVLCRSKSKAKESWMKSMPNQTTAILNSKNVVLIVGDITKPNYGISPIDLAEIESQVTIIIHAVSYIHETPHG
jgi:fatty acyl-CoA reductase